MQETEFFQQEQQYYRDVAELFEQTGGDISSPEWFKKCAELDEWNAAVAQQE